MRRLAWPLVAALALVVAGCLNWLKYEFSPEELAYDIPAAGSGAPSSFPDVSCAQSPTVCAAAGTRDSACHVVLTDAGRNLLGTLAQDFNSPFNVIGVAHLKVHSGDAVPSGKIDLFVQPVISFGLP